MEKKKGDELWDLRKQQANKVAELYSLLGLTDEWYKIKNCSTELEFIHGYPAEGGSAPQRLVKANFCRLRMCPVCQWRRSIRWQAKAFQSLPRIMQTYPTQRWLFLTLTVKNCPLEELRMQIDRMNHGFSKWTQGKEWPATGWIKSLEITRGTDDTAHPHFHILMLVPSSYFGRDYIRHETWCRLWAKYMKLEYFPMVNIQAVPVNEIQKAIPEIAKYQCKPQDLIDEDGEWLLELGKQMKNVRGINIGGYLKSFFKGKEAEDEEDLIGKSLDKIALSPITSTWKWEFREGENYEAEYSFNGFPIEKETAIEQFATWAGY